MNAAKFLIVNGDDFGLSLGINAGIIEAHEQGILTSASLMVRGPAAAEAAGYARRNTSLSLGLHVDLGEWVCPGGNWEILYEVVPRQDVAAVRGEVRRQLEAFRNLTGTEPTHLDSHQHFHRTEPVRSVLTDAAGLLGIPLRGITPGISHCGKFYGQTAEGRCLPDFLTARYLLGVLEDLPAGVTELGCHPGKGTDFASPYLAEREEEVKVLCSAEVREALPGLGISLCSFRTALQASRNGHLTPAAR